MGQSFAFDIPSKELFLIDDKRNRGLHPYGLKGIKILSADGSSKICRLRTIRFYVCRVQKSRSFL